MRRRVDLKATRLVADMLREAASNVEATFFEVALPLITEARQAVRAMGRGEKLPVNDDLAPLRARVARLEGALEVETLAQALCDSSSHMNTLPHAEQRPCQYHRDRAINTLKQLRRAALAPDPAPRGKGEA